MALRKYLPFLFGFVLSILLFDGIVTFRNLQRWSDNNKAVIHTQRVIIEIGELRSLFRFVLNRFQTYILTGEKKYYSDFQNFKDQRRIKLESVRTLTLDNPGQQKRLEEIKAIADAQDPLYEKAFQSLRRGKLEPSQKAVFSSELNRLADRVRAVAIEFTNEENELLTQRANESSAAFRQTLWIFGVSMGATVLLVIAVLALTLRSLNYDAKLKQIELRLSTVIQNAPLILYSLNPKGVVTLSTGKGLEAIGLKPGGSMGKSVFDVYPENSSILDKVRKALGGEESHGLVEVNGHFVEALYKPIKDKQGKVTEVVGVAIDVTARRKAEAANEEKTRLLDSVMGNMSEGIVVADQKGKMIYFNEGAKRIIGIGMSANASSEWTREYGVFQEDGVTSFQEEDLPLVKAVKGIPTTGVVQFLRNAGHPEGIFISVSGTPLRGAKGELQGGLVVVRDISGELKAQRALKDYSRQLEENNRDLQDFVFVASHDLQEPLRKIQSFGQFLVDEFKEILGETGGDYVGRMQSAAKRMQILINDLLSLTRVTTKAQPFSPVDLNQVLREVLVDLEVRIGEKKGQVEVSALPTLMADATQIRQLFQNLISNALKFNKPGQPPRVKVGAEKEKTGSRGWLLRVEDNGIGFDNKYADQIFKVFERLHGRDEYEGTGIGLAICRKVVERHGGTIKAEGVPGQGSIFTIELPGLSQD